MRMARYAALCFASAAGRIALAWTVLGRADRAALEGHGRVGATARSGPGERVSANEAEG